VLRHTNHVILPPNVAYVGDGRAIGTHGIDIPTVPASLRDRCLASQRPIVKVVAVGKRLSTVNLDRAVRTPMSDVLFNLQLCPVEQFLTTTDKQRRT
jgi:hypothetical protein